MARAVEAARATAVASIQGFTGDYFLQTSIREAPSLPNTVNSPAPHRPSGSSLPEGFRKDIEGLRGLAILLVVAYHAGVPGFGGGFVGVDVFFVLSGYLITGLLRAEWVATGRIDLWSFYARRVRRLFPAAAVMLVVVMAAAWFLLAPWEVSLLAGSARAAAGYLSNVRFAMNATDYLGGGNGSDLFLHTWSLSVEEQFYLTWPLVLWVGFLWSGERGRALVVMLAISGIASLACSVILTDRIQPWAFFMMPTRWWEFCGGGLVRIATSERHHVAKARWASALGLVLIGLAATHYGDSTPFPGFAAALPVLATAGILAAPCRWSQALLKSAVLQRLGKISYALYLWHWPLLALAATLNPSIRPVQKATLIVVSVALAELSTRCLERPIRRSAALNQHARTVVLAGAASIVSLIIGFSALRLAANTEAQRPPFNRLVSARKDLPRLYADGCVIQPLATDPKAGCTYGAPAPKAKIVLFGDSHAAQWFPAIERLGGARKWQITVVTKSSCPAASLTVYSDVLKRPFDECDRWRKQVIARINTMRPDLVLMSSYAGYSSGDPGTTRTSISPSKLAEGYRRTAEAVHNAKTMVIIQDIPTLPFDPSTCLARRVRLPGIAKMCEITADGDPTQDPLTSVGHEAQPAIARSGIWEVNLNRWICPGRCPLERKGASIYRDSHHLTASFSASLAPILGQELDRIDASRQAP